MEEEKTPDEGFDLTYRAEVKDASSEASVVILCPGGGDLDVKVEAGEPGVEVWITAGCIVRNV